MSAPPSGLDDDERLAYEIVALLRGGNAHVSAERALAGVPPERVNDRVDGLPHSLWDLLWHLHATQADLLDFCVNPSYRERAWPDAYWPADEAADGDWERVRADVLVDLERLVRLVQPRGDLMAELPHAPGYTLLRELLLAADHTSHHLGQVVSLRRQLGLWPPDA
jgi:uncharacterized damage-inducible protein DinB